MPLKTVIARAAAVALSTVVALALAEGILRGVGFEFRAEPAVQFGWPDPTAIERRYEPDPDLVWVTRGYRARLATAARRHPAIVFMGDSCTEFGSYPRETIERLAPAHPGLAGLTVATGGWSSEQGRAQLTRDVLPLAPRIITIYYGWNDHWMALGPSDRDILLARRFRALATHLRIGQLALRAWFGWAAARHRGAPRVPIDRYRDNLRALILEARAHRVEPVIITAPSGHVAGHEPEYLAKRHLAHLSDLVPLHAAYVDATRDVARRTGAVLCDAAAVFSGDPQRHAYFRRDGIHLNRAGNRRMAQLIASCVDGLLSGGGRTESANERMPPAPASDP